MNYLMYFDDIKSNELTQSEQFQVVIAFATFARMPLLRLRSKIAMLFPSIFIENRGGTFVFFW